MRWPQASGLPQSPALDRALGGQTERFSLCIEANRILLRKTRKHICNFHLFSQDRGTLLREDTRSHKFCQGQKGRKAALGTRVSPLPEVIFPQRNGERERLKPTEILIPTAAELVKGAGKEGPLRGMGPASSCIPGRPANRGRLFLQNLFFPISGLEFCKTF